MTGLTRKLIKRSFKEVWIKVKDSTKNGICKGQHIYPAYVISAFNNIHSFFK